MTHWKDVYDEHVYDEFEYDEDLADFKNCMCFFVHTFYEVQQDEERMNLSGERHKYCCGG